jgi:tRNA(Ile)-lysidine synthase
LLAPLADFAHIVVAVSGGPDSMALLHLLAEWRQGLGDAAPIIAAATIDHGLRPESAAEARFVAAAAAALGITHTTAKWNGRKPARGLPAAARAARYRLLRAIAEDAAPSAFSAVATAHTLDDQAETFLMRLARGSGVEGLAEMKRLRAIEPDEDCFVMLVRPLLDIPKARLIATLQARGVTWVEDPSNARLDQERPRLRALLARLEQEGLAAPAIARSAQRLRRAEEALQFADSHFAADLEIKVDREIYAELDAQAFQEGPRLLRERLLARLITRFGGSTPPPELSEVEDLVVVLEGGEAVRATLGGAVVSQGARAIRVWREAGRASAAHLRLKDVLPCVWDDRFWVSAAGAQAQAPVQVRCLGPEGVAELPDGARPDDAPARALWALPGFYLGQRLISVPTLAYHSLGYPECKAVPVH